MSTNYIWTQLGNELFFFTLKRVKNEEITKEILQESFLKVHLNLSRLRDTSRFRAWTYQIVRNEISNFYSKEKGQDLTQHKIPQMVNSGVFDSFCCFEKFITKLPDNLRVVIEEVHILGKTQSEAAEHLDISLANTKARIRRAKDLLKKDFQKCCNYKINEEGLLMGESDCGSCV